MTPQPHKCQSCDRVFSSKFRLHTHQQTHLPENERKRPFKCSEQGCDKAFFSNQDLKRHCERSHTNAVGQYKCSSCGRSFHRSFSRNRHVAKGLCRLKPTSNQLGSGLEAVPSVVVEDHDEDVSTFAITPLEEHVTMEPHEDWRSNENNQSRTDESFIDKDLWHIVKTYEQIEDKLHGQATIARLLHNGADPNLKLCRSEDKSRPHSILSFAICQQATVVVKLLLEAGADVHLRDHYATWSPFGKSSRTPLQFACYEDVPPEITEMVFSKTYDEKDINRSLIVAASVSNPRRLSVLLDDLKADVRYLDKVCALRMACSTGCLQNVKLLLAAGAEPNQKDRFHRSVLRYLMPSEQQRNHKHKVNAEERSSILHLLISSGIDINQRNVSGGTTLHECITNMYYINDYDLDLLSYIKCLRSCGLDCERRDGQGFYPLNLLDRRILDIVCREDPLPIAKLNTLRDIKKYLECPAF